MFPTRKGWDLLLVIVMVTVTLLPVTTQLTVQEYLTLNQEQKLKLDQFRTLISTRLPHSYMKKDVYLIRWLRDQDFDLPAAEERLMNHLTWRQENRMDTILEEDWSAIESQNRLYLQGCDKDGKPVISATVGEWDVRRGLITGTHAGMTRYFDKCLEESALLIRRMQDDGQLVTQISLIFDFKNFDIISQACARCIPIYLSFITNIRQHFPGFAHKLIALNVPEIALPFYDLLKTRMNQQFKEFLAVYGRNKADWSRHLLQEIDPDQLSVALGGRNEEALDYWDFLRRLNGTVPSCKVIKNALIQHQKEQPW